MTDVVVRKSWSMIYRRTDLMHFTSLFLCLVIMLTRQIKCLGCSLESVDIVQKIAKELGKLDTNDYMLYTPTLADYENCSRSTLKCFALEVNVLVLEINSVTRLSQQLPKMLRNLTLKLQDKSNPCPDCEVYKEEKAEIFLEILQNILQRLNAELCPKGH